MKEYHKIETLFKFDSSTNKYTNTFYNQNVELLKNHLWVFTEKIDGTNFRICWDGHKLTYAGRTDKAMFSDEQIDFIEDQLVNEEKEIIFEQTFQDKEVIVFGELYGNKIQNGGLYTDGKGLAFKVFDILIDDIYLTYGTTELICKQFNYDIVPIVLEGTINDGINYVKNNNISTFSKANLEGLVGKPVGGFRDRLGKRIVVKIKKRDLEKTEELGL